MQFAELKLSVTFHFYVGQVYNHHLSQNSWFSLVSQLQTDFCDGSHSRILLLLHFLIQII